MIRSSLNNLTQFGSHFSPLRRVGHNSDRMLNGSLAHCRFCNSPRPRATLTGSGQPSSALGALWDSDCVERPTHTLSIRTIVILKFALMRDLLRRIPESPKKIGDCFF